MTKIIVDTVLLLALIGFGVTCLAHPQTLIAAPVVLASVVGAKRAGWAA